MQEESCSFDEKIATSIQLVSRVKWGLPMVLLGYGSNDGRSICMKLFK